MNHGNSLHVVSGHEQRYMMCSQGRDSPVLLILHYISKLQSSQRGAPLVLWLSYHPDLYTNRLKLAACPDLG